MGFTIYFQRSKYQKNHFDTFSAMLYFALTFYRQLIQSHGVVTFVATFTWNARHTLTVKNSSQMLRAHRKRTERRRKVRNGKGERVGGEQEGSRLQCKMQQDKAKFFLFILMKRKESCARKRGGGEKEGRGEDVLPFQRYYQLSECSCFFSYYTAFMTSTTQFLILLGRLNMP